MSDEYREIKEMYDGREATDRHPSNHTVDPSKDDELVSTPMYDNSNFYSIEEQLLNQ